MKKLLIIVASALTFGAYAGDAGDTPIVVSGLDAAGIDAGDTIALVRDGETIASTTYADQSSINFATEGAGTYVITANDTPITSGIVRKLGSASAPTFVTAHPKTVGEEQTVVYDCVASFVRETETNTLPDGWTSKQYNGDNTPHFTLAANGAVVKYPWKKNALQTACDITNDATATIDIETFSNAEDCNAVIFLASENYSVAIGNSYSSNKGIVIGSANVDAATKYASFQDRAAASVGFVPENQVTVADPGELNVGGSLHYNLVINGTELSGTVTDGTTTKDITFTLPAEYAFTTVGCALDGDTNKVGLKSFSIADNRKDIYLTIGNNVQHIDLGSGETFTDAAGEVATHESRLDSIHVNTSVQLFVYRAYSGAKFIVGDEDHAEVNLGFARTNSGDATMDSFDVTVNNNGIVEINNVTRGGSWKASMNPEVKGSKIHGSGKVTIPSGQNVTISDASVIELPIEMSGTATLVVKTGSTVTTVVTNDANKEIKAEEVDGGIKYTVVNVKHTLTLGPTGDERVKAQVKIGDDGVWVDYTSPMSIEHGSKVSFQYVSVDDTKWTVVCSATGLFYSSFTKDQTYNIDSSKLTVTAVGPALPEAIDEGGSEAQQTAYKDWVTTLAESSITIDPTATGVSEAFALSLTAADLEGKTFEKAVEDKLDTLITADMVAELAAKAAEGETTVTIEGFENATFKFVPVEEIETSAKLFRLAVSFKPMKVE